MRSLTTKLVLAFLAVTLIGVLLVAFFIGRQTERAFNRFLLDRNQEQILSVLNAYYSEFGTWEGLHAWWPTVRQPFGQTQHRERFFWGLVTDVDGNLVFPPNARGQDKLEPDDLRRAVPIYAGGESPNAGEVVGYVLFDARRAFGPKIQTPESVFIDQIRQAVQWGAFGAIIVALLVAILLARTITRPIVALTEATRVVTAGRLGHQVAVTSRDEIGELALAFNQMSESLDESTRQRKQLTADIAHDLRTPLSIILGYTEALSDGKLAGSAELFETVHGEAKHLNHLIEDLRTLSLADAGELTLQKRTVAPEELLARAAAAHLVHAEERDITIAVDAETDMPLVHVDLERMAQVFNNLVSNALRHTPDGGIVVLESRAQSTDVFLSVTDSGDGIAAEDLPHIFERFYRSDKSRSSNGESGLGLPIVKSIVEAHGGTVRAANVPDGGATLIVCLPAAPRI